MIIKAGSVKNLTDARYFAAKGAHWLGLNVEPDEQGALGLFTAKSIISWIEGINIVGEFNNLTPQQVYHLAEELDLDGIQIPAWKNPADYQKKFGKKITIFSECILDITISPDFLPTPFYSNATQADYLVLNFRKNDFTWPRIRQNFPEWISKLITLSENIPILADLDLAVGSMEEMLDTIPFAGLNLLGGAEEKVGVKSFEELDEIFDIIESRS